MKTALLFAIACASADLVPLDARAAGRVPAARVIAAGDGRTLLLEPLAGFDGSRVLYAPTTRVVVDHRGDRVVSAHVLDGGPLRIGDLLYVGTVTLRPGLAREMNRVWARVRPMLGVRNVGGDSRDGSLRPGVVIDVGAEVTTARGFRIGAEIAPIAVVSNVYTPSTSVRVHFGYATEFVAIGVGIGCSLAFFYPQAGPVLRLGRFDRTHALLRLSWSIYPPRVAPVDGQLELNVPVRGRTRLHAEVGGAYGNLLGAYGLVGAQIALRGNGGPRSLLVTAGAGISWIQYSLGPALSIGIEERW